MEILGLVNIPSWILTIILIFLSLYLYTVWKQSLWIRLGVPGPTPFPFIGALKDMMKKGATEMDIGYTKKYGDIVGYYMGTLPVLSISDPEMIKQTYIKEFSNFTNRSSGIKPDKFWKESITIVQDDHWKFLRSTMTPTFTTGKLKNMLPMIQKCCDDMVENIGSKEEELVEMKQICGSYTMDVICSTSFGLQINSQKEPNNEFVSNVKGAIISSIMKPWFLLLMIFPFLRPFFTPRVMKKEAEEFFQNVIHQLITERKSSHDNKFRDFIQLMINAHQDNDKGGVISELGARDFAEYKTRGLTEKEILVNSVLFFAAGYDTTANTLAFAVYTLSVESEIQEKLIAEIDQELGKTTPTYESLSKLEYLDRFLSEVLRLYSAATRINRDTRKDITVNGQFIPKGTSLTIPICALHRNPKFWPDPEKFDPDRFTEEKKAERPPYTYLPFGLGPRVCIGMRLALVEAKFALINMLQNFRFKPCEKTEIPIKIEKGFLTRPLNGVYVKTERR